MVPSAASLSTWKESLLDGVAIVMMSEERINLDFIRMFPSALCEFRQ